jgi:hypothetical protein
MNILPTAILFDHHLRLLPTDVVQDLQCVPHPVASPGVNPQHRKSQNTGLCSQMECECFE